MPLRLALSTWSGTRYYAIRVVGETPARLRVELKQAVKLPGGRLREAGKVVLVPRTAIRESGTQPQAFPCDGRIYGYGGTVDSTEGLASPSETDLLDK